MINNKLMLFMIMILFLFSFISAEQQSLGLFKKGEVVRLIQTCSNCSYVNISSILYPNSTQAWGENTMIKVGTEYTLNFYNTTTNGQYIVNGHADVDGIDTIWGYTFEVTPNGGTTSSGKAVFYSILLGVIMLFLILTIYLFISFDNLLNRVAMIGIGYLLLIAITFIGWNMASDFLTSAPFIISMLRILFFVFIAGAFPLLVGGFAWYVLMMFRIKEIQSLMDKGMPMEEAERRQGRKYK